MTKINNSVILLLSLMFIISCSDKTEYIDNNNYTDKKEETAKVVIKQKQNFQHNSDTLKLGCDVLEINGFDILKNKKVGLVTNRTGVNSRMISTIDLLFDSEDVDLVALFGPEHGIRGDYEGGDLIKSYIDSKTGLPVYSLYGKNRRPDKDMLDNLDVIVYDIQDIGIRSYTYISTLGNFIEEASKYNIEFVVLDRPNPLGGQKIEGNIIENDFSSFIGQYPIPYVYGLTCGELSKLIVGEKYINTNPNFKLTVIPMRNWSRSMVWDDTNLDWIPTSPHIPYSFSPFYCTMTGILGELRSAISVGVGYTLPFQVIGAEWINPEELANQLDSYKIPGLKFNPISFKPYYAFGKGKTLNGVQIYVNDYQNTNLLRTQFYIMHALKTLYPEKNIFELADKNEIKMFNKGIGSDFVYKQYQKSFNLEKIFNFLEKDIDQFRKIAENYYLYP